MLLSIKKRLLNTVSDGDIRRALIQGYKLNDKIKKIKLRKPTTVKADTNIFEIKKI